MGGSSVPPRVKLFPSASVCVLSLFGVSLIHDAAESLRIVTSARLFSNEQSRSTRQSGRNLPGSGVTFDVNFATAPQRHSLAKNDLAYPSAAEAPSALLSWIPVLSNEEKGHVSKLPAFGTVDLGLFDLINPLPENEAKGLDLSWLSHVMKTTGEPAASSAMKSSSGLHDTERKAADREASSVSEHGIDGVDKWKRSLPERGKSEAAPNSAYPTRRHGSGWDNDDIKLDTDPTSKKQKQRRGSSSGSLAEAIEATGDKGLIEEAGLESRNPWEMIDEADKQDRQKREKLMEGRKREQPPAVGRHGDASRTTSVGAAGPAPAEDDTAGALPLLERGAHSTETRTESCTFVGSAIKVDARFVCEAENGSLNVQYGPDAAKLQRVVLVENTSSERLRIFARIVDATFTPEATFKGAESGEKRDSSASSFLEASANFLKQTFLQMGSLLVAPPENSHTSDAHKPVLASVDDIMEEFRQSQEDRPGKSSELIINLGENDTESFDAQPTESVLDSAEGAQLIKELRQLMQQLFGETKQAVEVMKTVGVIIISFPPGGAENSAKVKEMVEFVRRSFDGYMTRWSFAREVVVMSESSKDSLGTTASEGVSKSSKYDSDAQGSFVVENLPDDPELQKKLYGMFMTNMSSAWLHGEKGDGVVVAVVDTGVSAHPDLKCNFWLNANEQADGSDSDGNGLKDDIRGYDFDADRGDPEDDNGHGTHVAGIIGACANSAGVVGGSHGSKLISVRFMDKDGSGVVSNSIRAVAYAIDEGAHLINNSWGGPDNDTELHRVLRFTEKAHGGKGILVVNAAGNESVDNDKIPSYPANWKSKNTISVAAVDKDGHLASFSNWGAQTVDVAAPGVKIYSTAPGSGYQFLSGTSMAAPHVSAVAALVFGAFLRSGYHPLAEEVKDIIRLTVKKIPNLKGLVSWEGIPNARDAVLVARMGGMWAQCACNDMIVDAPPGAVQKITLFFSGYKLGTYSAHLAFDVFNEQQIRVDKIRIPFTLVSSRHPADNKYTDAEVQAAFSNVTNVNTAASGEDSVDLCRLQAKFLALDALLPQWAVILMAVGGAIILLALAVSFFVYMKRRRQYSSHPSPEEEAILPRKAGKLQEDDDTETSSGISSSPSRESNHRKRRGRHGRDVPNELYSQEEAYR